MAGQAHACRQPSRGKGNVRSTTTCGGLAAGERITALMWLYLLVDRSCVWFRTLFTVLFAERVKLPSSMVQRDMTIQSGKVAAGFCSHVCVCPLEHGDYVKTDCKHGELCLHKLRSFKCLFLTLTFAEECLHLLRVSLPLGGFLTLRLGGMFSVVWRVTSERPENRSRCCS